MTNMQNTQQEYKVSFYIKQFRGIFKKILFIYGLSIVCILYLFYKINTRIEPVYYAASENGKLKLLTAYNTPNAPNAPNAPEAQN